MDDDQRRKWCPVDRVEQEHPARLQDALNFIEDPVQLGDVLQDVHTDNAVDAMVGKGDAFTAADLVIDLKRVLHSMILCGADRCLRGIDANDRGTLPGQRLRHKAAAASEIEHGLAAPGANDGVEMLKSRRDEVMQ